MKFSSDIYNKVYHSDPAVNATAGGGVVAPQKKETPKETPEGSPEGTPEGSNATSNKSETDNPAVDDVGADTGNEGAAPAESESADNGADS